MSQSTQPHTPGAFGPRWPWLGAGALLLSSALAAAWATYLHWLPCRGSMFDGTAFAITIEGSFSDACLRRMDTGTPFVYPPEPAEQTPWASELGAIAVALTGLAWLILALGIRWPARTKIIAALPAATPLVLAFLSVRAAADPGRNPDAYVSTWLWISGEIAMFVVLVLVRGWHPELAGLGIICLAVVGWGSTAFGFLHAVLEYVAMSAFNSSNWDTPPGTGWTTVFLLTATGLFSLVVGVRWGGPHQGAATKDRGELRRVLPA